MTTAFLHKLLIVVPAARQAALNGWWLANIDPVGGAQTFTAGLSTTSALPATHFWAAPSLTNAELKLVIQRLIALANAGGAGIVLPAGWDTMTRAQKIAWVESQWAAIKTATGIDGRFDPNDGAWSDYQAKAAGNGLRPVDIA